MALLDLWKNDREQVKEKLVKQIIAFAGSTASEQDRKKPATGTIGS